MLLLYRSRELQRNCLGVFTDVAENRTWPKHCSGNRKSRFKSVTCVICGLQCVEMGFRAFHARNGVIFQQNI